MKKCTFTLDEKLYNQLHRHLFPGDHDEHGAIIIAGVSEDENEIRFLGRELVIARDGVEYLPGKYGYRRLSAEFVANQSQRCSVSKLCYFAVHCHSGENSVDFSSIDMESHKRGYPALLDITKGGPVGALVFAKNAVAGEIWTPSQIYKLSHLTIIGSKILKLYPNQQVRSIHKPHEIYDRHIRLFGDAGQDIINNLKVGIIGLGGGGSLINEFITRLGVGQIIAVDDQKIEPTNLPRVVGSTQFDAMTSLFNSKTKLLRKLGKSLSKSKVHIAKRVAKTANKNIDFVSIQGNVLDENVATKLKNCDFLFLATDNHQTRLVFNALVQQYLIPGIQIGVFINKDKETSTVDSILINTRPVMPYLSGGCLECHQLISPIRLQEESLTPDERRKQRYVDFEEVPQPNVITLNAVSAAQAVNDFMMMFTGLFSSNVNMYHIQQEAVKRERFTILSALNTNCLDCSLHPKSRKAKGDRARLPCRWNE